ncbi:M15 family metallopeptidase [Edaphobacillus lindanitolerans]|uniref:D-alanyl-D-alanine carboxypeptidase n=1 Tax=Edaphobacillus lindanitolerans TaxID=550447 RepID=A0A1U7PSH0_9BACI|nr:M15 family metallopeptidase [Edaphobacillus lindanitolerans]SIT89487.1 D-alanyl-D-alanine carboxypeptidase [Edaphobacillus lindanitolerans]
MRRVDYLNKKKRKNKGWIVASAIAVLVLGGGAAWTGAHDWDLKESAVSLKGVLGGGTEKSPADQSPVPPQSAEEDQAPASGGGEQPVPEEKDDASDALAGIGEYDDDRPLPSEPTYIDGVLLANKKYPLPADFAPGEDPEARAAFDEMAAAAKLDGFELAPFSTFRTFERQKELYDQYVARDGVEAADRYSARPGYSEHQTGLTFDIGEANQEQHWARNSFGDTEAGKWLFANAHRFGFILRYPEGKEDITGYMHESWHYRYVGKELAAKIHSENLTLEEYLLGGQKQKQRHEPEPADPAK